MNKVFVNHTNHPSAKWSDEQKNAAETFGKVVDVPFPEVPPNIDTAAVHELVLNKLQDILNLNPSAVLCQGEFNYTVAMAEELKRRGIPVMAATSERVVSEVTEADGSTKRVSVFNFVRFREY